VSVLARRAEVAKLAHVGVEIDLALEADDLRAVREAISARLFDDARPVLQRVATGSRLLPTGLVAKVGETVFGATLCAQVAGLLAPPYALELALKMSDPFLAEVSAAIDPRSANEVVRRIPTDRIVSVAHVLLAKHEYVTLARFVDYLSPETIAAVIDSVPDELQLLRIGAYVESPTKLAELVGQLAPERTRAMIAALRGGDGALWLEALTIAEALDEAWRERLGDIAAELGIEVLGALVEAVCRFAMWPAAMPFILAMSEPSQRRFLEVPALHDRAVVTAIVDAAVQLDRRAELVQLAARTPAELGALLADVMR
jgi:hypothetical protein